jgi:hypothetical protein
MIGIQPGQGGASEEHPPATSSNPVPARDFDRWPQTGDLAQKSLDITDSSYDSRPQEDQARRNIAYCLIALLFFICIASFITLWCTKIPVEQITKILQILLGPVIALVSAMTGVYYGTKSKT